MSAPRRAASLLLLLPALAGPAAVPSAEPPGVVFDAVAAAQAPPRQEQGLYLLGGQTIGYYRRVTAPDGEGGFRTEVRERLAVTRAGDRFTVSRRETWLEGETLRRLEADTDLNGQLQRLEAEAGPEGFAATLQQGGAVERRLVPAAGPVLGVHGAAVRGARGGAARRAGAGFPGVPPGRGAGGPGAGEPARRWGR